MVDMHSSRGSIIIPLVISISIAFITAFLLLEREFQQQGQVMMLQSSVLNLEAFKNSVRAALLHPENLAATITAAANNPGGGANLQDCMNNPTYNCATGAHDLTVVLANGSVLANPNQGLRADWRATTGSTCAPFGGDDCPFQYQFRWQPSCPIGGPCVHPKIAVTATLQYNPGLNRMNFNPTRYPFAMTLN